MAINFAPINLSLHYVVLFIGFSAIAPYGNNKENTRWLELNAQHQAAYTSTHKMVFFSIFCHAVTLTFGFLTPKTNQFISVPRCTFDKSLVKIHQCIPQISRKQHHRWMHPCTHVPTHRQITRKHNAADTTLWWRRHKNMFQTINSFIFFTLIACQRITELTKHHTSLNNKQCQTDWACARVHTFTVARKTLPHSSLIVAVCKITSVNTLPLQPVPRTLNTLVITWSPTSIWITEPWAASWTQRITS